MSFNDLLGKIGGLGRSISGAMSPWSTIAQAGNSIVGSFLGNSMSRKALRQQKELMNFSAGVQKDIMDYQNQQNIASWNMQNEYNTPAAQMQRIKDAGLNTNLIYGQNGLQAGNAESIASGTGASLNSNIDAKVASGIMSRQMDLQAFQAMKQGALVDSQIDLNNANAEFSRAQAQEVAPNAASQRLVNQYVVNQLDVVTQREDQYISYFNRIENFKWFQELYGTDKLLYESQGAKVGVGCALATLEKLGIDNQTALYALNELLPQEKRESISREKKNYSDISLNRVSMLLTAALMTEAQARTNGYNIENGWKSELYSNMIWKQSQFYKPFYENLETIAKQENLDAQTYWEQRGAKNSGGAFGTGINVYNLTEITPILLQGAKNNFNKVKSWLKDNFIWAK